MHNLQCDAHAIASLVAPLANYCCHRARVVVRECAIGDVVSVIDCVYSAVGVCRHRRSVEMANQVL
jgi:hypothetical protein